MNLVKKLNQTARENYEKQIRAANEALDSVKANLQIEDSRDAEMLKFFGTEEVVRNQTDSLATAEKFINGEYLTIEDIKKVCLSYNLRFLKSKHYKKEVPINALNDLRKFRDGRGLNDYYLNDNLYIIAPSSHFKLGERVSKDPVLLYKNGNGTYTVVSKWGNDLSWTRKIGAFFMRSPNIILFIAIAFVINTICTIGFLYLNFAGDWYALNLLAGAFGLYCILDDEGFIEPLTQNWNSPTKSI